MQRAVTDLQRLWLGALPCYQNVVAYRYQINSSAAEVPATEHACEQHLEVFTSRFCMLHTAQVLRSKAEAGVMYAPCLK